MKKKIAFFDSKPYDEESFLQNALISNFDCKFFTMRLSVDSLPLCENFDAVCCFVNDDLSEAIIEGLASYGIKIIALRCAGYNHVDLQAVSRHGLHVVHVPNYSSYAIAEHTVALMLSLNRKIHRAYNRTREANFSINGFLGFDIYQKTIGVVGMGKIARSLVSILKGFGANVIAYDIYADEEYAAKAGIRFTSLDELLRSSDIISLHCPLTKETKHMINEKSIALMKDGVMIINTGRGKLIDSQALIKGLKSGKVGSAGLDVYEEESEYFFEDRSAQTLTDDVLARLLSFHNVIITSHQAFFTREAMQNISRTTLENLLEYFDGKSLSNEVHPLKAP